jgi:hypothetical protein
MNDENEAAIARENPIRVRYEIILAGIRADKAHCRTFP